MDATAKHNIDTGRLREAVCEHRDRRLGELLLGLLARILGFGMILGLLAFVVWGTLGLL